MISTLDYNSAIKYQYEDLEKNKKRVERYFGVGQWVTQKLIPGLLKRLNGLLISHLLSTKGGLTEISNNIDKIQGRDLSKQISSLNMWLELCISFQGELEKLIEENEHKKYRDLVISQATLAEIIENLYSILRILKKANLKSPKETSELAKDLSRLSVNSLEKVLYGH